MTRGWAATRATARMARPQATRGRARGGARGGFGSRALGTLGVGRWKAAGTLESAWLVHEITKVPSKKAARCNCIWAFTMGPEWALVRFGPISRQTSSAHRKPTIPAQRSSWASVAIALRGCWRGSRSAGKNPTRLGTSLRRRRRRRCRRWRTSRTCWARPGSPAAERLRGSATLWPPSRSSPSAGRPGLRRRRPNPSLGSPARR